MSFISIKHKTRNRLNENLQFLNHISSAEPTNPQDPVSLEVNIMKGLFYVHLYASIEKMVNELVEHTIILINTKSISVKHYNHAFNSIALLNQLKSFKDCSHKSFFEKAYEIFNQTNNSNATSLNERAFANRLQNVWFETITEITLCFGVKGLNTSPRVRTTIDEIVNNRNAVAHGRETAADIGSRFRTPIIRTKYNEVENFLYELIDLYSNYFNNKDYLKVGSKRLYV